MHGITKKKKLLLPSIFTISLIEMRPTCVAGPISIRGIVQMKIQINDKCSVTLLRNTAMVMHGSPSHHIVLIHDINN